MESGLDRSWLRLDLLANLGSAPLVPVGAAVSAYGWACEVGGPGLEPGTLGLKVRSIAFCDVQGPPISSHLFLHECREVG
jgi:hypothetical protein